jgi:hypothetical protein
MPFTIASSAAAVNPLRLSALFLFDLKFRNLVLSVFATVSLLREGKEQRREDIEKGSCRTIENMGKHRKYLYLDR